MLKATVLKYFGGSMSRAASAIGVSRTAVWKWPEYPEHIPAMRALEYQRVTGGELRFNPRDYGLQVRSRKPKRPRKPTNDKEEMPSTAPETEAADAPA